MQLHMHQTLVCIHDLLHRYTFIAVEYKRRLSIVVLEHLPVIFQTHSLDSPRVHARKDTPRKITPQRHKIDLRGPTCWEGASGVNSLLHDPSEILLDLRQMLVSKQLVDRNIIASITEMRSLSRLLSGTCRTGYGCHMDLVIDQACPSKRQGRKLDCSRKTTRVRHIMGSPDLLAGTLA